MAGVGVVGKGIGGKCPTQHRASDRSGSRAWRLNWLASKKRGSERSEHAKFSDLCSAYHRPQKQTSFGGYCTCHRNREASIFANPTPIKAVSET
jgi:hypothetical protein